MPELIKRGVPEYPRKAKYAGIEATVYVMVWVGKNGKPVDAKIRKSSDSDNAYGFNDVVLKAAMQCRFKPAIQYGKPVNVWVTFPYEFTLSRR
jgi:protein TonB